MTVVRHRRRAEFSSRIAVAICLIATALAALVPLAIT